MSVAESESTSLAGFCRSIAPALVVTARLMPLMRVPGTVVWLTGPTDAISIALPVMPATTRPPAVSRSLTSPPVLAAEKVPTRFAWLVRSISPPAAVMASVSTSMMPLPRFLSETSPLVSTFRVPATIVPSPTLPVAPVVFRAMVPVRGVAPPDSACTLNAETEPPAVTLTLPAADFTNWLAGRPVGSPRTMSPASTTPMLPPAMAASESTSVRRSIAPPAATRAVPVVTDTAADAGALRSTSRSAASETTPRGDVIPSTTRSDVAPVAASETRLPPVEETPIAVIVEADVTPTSLRAERFCSLSAGTGSTPSLETLRMAIWPCAAVADSSDVVVSIAMLPVWATSCTVPATRSEAASAAFSPISVAVSEMVPVPPVPVSIRPIESFAPALTVTLPPVVTSSGASSGRIVPLVSAVVWVIEIAAVELVTLPDTLFVLVRSVAELVAVNTTSFAVSRPGVALVVLMPPCRAASVIFWASGVRTAAPASSVPTLASIVRSPPDAVSVASRCRLKLASPTTMSPVTDRIGAVTITDPSLVEAPWSSRDPLVELRTRSPLPVRLTASLRNCETTAACGASRAVQLSREALIEATLEMIAVPVACVAPTPPPEKVTLGGAA